MGESVGSFGAFRGFDVFAVVTACLVIESFDDAAGFAVGVIAVAA